MDRGVKKGDTVKVHYAGKFETGELFDTSREGDPLIFTVGGDDIIPGFGDATIGMSVGETKTISIEPEQAYGPYKENLIIDMPTQYFPEDISPEKGLQLNIVDENDQEVPVEITEVRDDYIRLDANHPLAGKKLIFDIELLEIE